MERARNRVVQEMGETLYVDSLARLVFSGVASLVTMNSPSQSISIPLAEAITWPFECLMTFTTGGYSFGRHESRRGSAEAIRGTQRVLGPSRNAGWWTTRGWKW